jgi:hypothetical protein
MFCTNYVNVKFKFLIATEISPTDCLMTDESFKFS